MATPRSTSLAKCATPSPERFVLAGPSVPLDPRVHAYRADLADVALAGMRFSPHYVVPQGSRCLRGSVMVKAAPSTGSLAVSQLLHGEEFAAVDRSGGWVWGYCRHDHYVGYVPATDLASNSMPTHRVSVASAIMFESASIKSRALSNYPFGALLAGTMAGEFLRTSAGFVHHRHIVAIDEVVTDFVASAELLLGLPYLWGGRGAGGIDCSGLVQVALAAAGIAAPRDSDQQRADLGRELAGEEAPRRGDLVFFTGHVGIMIDETRIIHANASWMAVTAEPLAEVVTRLLPTHPHPILARKRMTS